MENDEFPRSGSGNLIKQWLEHEIPNAKKYKNDSTEFWKTCGCNYKTIKGRTSRDVMS